MSEGEGERKENRITKRIFRSFYLFGTAGSQIGRYRIMSSTNKMRMWLINI